MRRDTVGRDGTVRAVRAATVNGWREGRRRGARLTDRRGWPGLFAGGLVFGLLVRLAFDAGGYFAPTYLAAGVIALAGTGILLLVHAPHWRLSTSASVALLSLLGLAVWTALSSSWSPVGDQAILDFERDVLYIGLLALAFVFAGSGRHARLVPWGVLAYVLLVCGAGVLSRLQPDVLGSADGITTRLSWPLTYSNAFGALAAFGFVLATGLAADPRARVALRAGASGAAVVLVVAAYLSLSRGAWVAGIVGLVVLVLLGAHRGSLLVTLAVVLGASALAVVRMRGYDGLFDDVARREADGDAYTPQLAFAVAAAVGLQALNALGRTSVPMQDLGRRLRRPAAWTAGACAAVAVVVYAAASDRVEGRVAEGTTAASDWVSRQWDEVMAPASYSQDGTGRLTTAKGSRSELYRVAMGGFADHPLRGDGAGGFEVRWYRERKLAETVRDAHSLPIETLGELGLVGAAFLAALLGAITAAVVRSRLRPGGLGRSPTAAVGAALAVWCVHAALDWAWQVPAVTGAALVLAAACFPEGRVLRRRSSASGTGGPATFRRAERRGEAAEPALRPAPAGSG